MQPHFKSLSEAVEHRAYFIKVAIDMFDLDSHTAEDYFSDTICKLLPLDISKDRMNCNYIIHVMKNIIIDKELRKMRIKTQQLTDYLVELYSPEIESISTKHVYKQVREQIYSLPYNQREVMILRTRFKMSLKEIESLLNLSSLAVRSRIWRAKQTLKNE